MQTPSRQALRQLLYIFIIPREAQKIKHGGRFLARITPC